MCRVENSTNKQPNKLYPSLSSPSTTSFLRKYVFKKREGKKLLGVISVRSVPFHSIPWAPFVAQWEAGYPSPPISLFLSSWELRFNPNRQFEFEIIFHFVCAIYWLRRSFRFVLSLKQRSIDLNMFVAFQLTVVSWDAEAICLSHLRLDQDFV